MLTTLPDSIALFLYKSVILPWETQLKNKSGCWDVKRSRETLKAIDIHLECVKIGEVESVSQKFLEAGHNNFIVFVSTSSQMKDLFRHLRNCAAHASISYYEPQTKEPILRLSGKLFRKPELAISGQITSSYLNQIVAALVTTPLTRLQHNPSAQTGATR